MQLGLKPDRESVLQDPFSQVLQVKPVVNRRKNNAVFFVDGMALDKLPAPLIVLAVKDDKLDLVLRSQAGEVIEIIFAYSSGTPMAFVMSEYPRFSVFHGMYSTTIRHGSDGPCGTVEATVNMVSWCSITLGPALPTDHENNQQHCHYCKEGGKAYQ